MRALRQGLLICVLTASVLLAASAGWKSWDRNTSRLVDGSEVTYMGVISDRGMSSFQDWHRSYISLELDDGTEVLFWEERGRDSIGAASVGDVVCIESAVEEATEVLVAVSMTVISEN